MYEFINIYLLIFLLYEYKFLESNSEKHKYKNEKFTKKITNIMNIKVLVTSTG